MSALSTCSYYGLEKIEKQSTGFFFQDKFQSLFAAPRAHAARSESKSGKNRTCRKNFRACGMIFIFNFGSSLLCDTLQGHFRGEKGKPRICTNSGFGKVLSQTSSDDSCAQLPSHSRWRGRSSPPGR